MLRIRDSLDQEFDVGTEGTAVSAPWCLGLLGKTQRLELGLAGGFFAERTWQLMLGPHLGCGPEPLRVGSPRGLLL